VIISSSVVIAADTWSAFLFAQAKQDTAGRQSVNETTNKVSFIITVLLNMQAFDGGSLITSLIEVVSTDVKFFEFRFVGCLHVQSLLVVWHEQCIAAKQQSQEQPKDKEVPVWVENKF
jgi:hypothetical protein